MNNRKEASLLRKNLGYWFEDRAIPHCWRLTSWRDITVTVAGMLVVVLAAGTALGQKAFLVMKNPGDLSQLIESKTIDEPEDSLFCHPEQAVERDWSLVAASSNSMGTA